MLESATDVLVGATEPLQAVDGSGMSTATERQEHAAEVVRVFLAAYGNG